MSILHKINSPQDIRELSMDELVTLCSELRGFIIDELSENPGHLGSGLGVIELTVALHYVYDTPNDKLIWDVGHQAYAHKILTGRRDSFHTNRKYGGISGFPKRSESEYDAFGGGHSSVSISAALGIDIASQITNKETHTIAVIGDGAMSGGLAFEGINNAGVSAKDLLVILNDNEISIDPNVGAMKEYLISITTSQRYNRFKQKAAYILNKIPFVGRFISALITSIKRTILQQSNLFESFGFRYFGPVDGHDVKNLVKVLKRMKHIKGPKLLHLLTVKGKGYQPAEESQTTWHAPGKFDPVTGKQIKNNVKTFMKFQDVFGHTLLELAQQNKNIIGVTPAMPTGCSMSIMQEVIPERVFDVGIAEGHAVTFCGGAATNGLLPFCNIYSSFMQRAYDNIIHDIVLQGVDVVLCLDRSGLVGEDGQTHHGVFDIAYLRCIPNIIIAAPMDEHQLRNLMYTASQGGYGAFVIRYPRGEGSIENWRNDFELVEIGKSKRLSLGDDIAVLSLGTTGIQAAEAIEELESEYDFSIEHIDLCFAKPLDKTMLHDIAHRHRKIITIEDGILAGGVGSAILEFMNENGYDTKIIRLGIKDKFISHGTIDTLQKECGYDKDAIKDTIKNALTNDTPIFYNIM